MVLILRDLALGPAVNHDLADTTGIDIRNVRYYLKLLHAERKIRIGGWEQRTGPALPVWHLGSGRDAPRPPRQSKEVKKWKRKQRNLNRQTQKAY